MKLAPRRRARRSGPRPGRERATAPRPSGRRRRRCLASGTSGRKAAAFYPGPAASCPARRPAADSYTGAHLRSSTGIRAAAWALVAAGVAAPVLRRRMQATARRGAERRSALAPLALCVAVRRSRARDVAVCALNMWAYLAAYEMPHDDPERLEQRVRIDYPIAVDRVIGLGVPPTVRLQRAFAAPASVNRFERVLVWCHWIWFMVPHASVVVRAAPRSGAVPGCGGPDVRRVRPRRRVLLGDPDRAARGGRQPTGASERHGDPRCGG